MLLLFTNNCLGYGIAGTPLYMHVRQLVTLYPQAGMVTAIAQLILSIFFNIVLNHKLWNISIHVRVSLPSQLAQARNLQMPVSPR